MTKISLILRYTIVRKIRVAQINGNIVTLRSLNRNHGGHYLPQMCFATMQRKVAPT